jgi:hypothetical protein
MNNYGEFCIKDKVCIDMVEHLKSDKNIISIALGGSRSLNDSNDRSDYDLFCVSKDDNFQVFHKEFVHVLERTPNILFAVESHYLEYWGYLFKALSKSLILFDISLISKSRINEISIRKTNKILYDIDSVYKLNIELAKDSDYETKNLELPKKEDYIKLFTIDWLKFNSSIKANDYWLALRFLERIKKYYLHLRRITEIRFTRLPHIPDKKFGTDIADSELCNAYKIDGKMKTLEESGNEIKKMIIALVPNNILFEIK